MTNQSQPIIKIYQDPAPKSKCHKYFNNTGFGSDAWPNKAPTSCLVQRDYVLSMGLKPFYYNNYGADF